MATVQIAINEALRDSWLAARMAEDPSFAQRVIDTLYYPSRCWERDCVRVPASPDDLRDYLVKRMSTARDAARKSAAPSGAAIPGSELRDLHGLLIALLETLADFPALRHALEDRAAFDDLDLTDLPDTVVALLPTDVYLRDIVPDGPKTSSLVRIVGGRNPGYAFRFDSQGVKLNAPRASPWLSNGQVGEAERQLATVEAFAKILESVKVGFKELIDTGLLPPTVAQFHLEPWRQAVRAATSTRRNSADVDAALTLGRKLVKALRQYGQRLGAALLLAASVRGSAGAVERVLVSISRLVDFATPPDTWLRKETGQPPSSLAGHPIVPEARALDMWLKDHEHWLLPAIDPNSGPLRDPSARYRKLAVALDGYFSVGAPLGPFAYEELVLATREETPYRFLHMHGGQMLARDWSGLALAAMPGRGAKARAPYWMLVAALRGLGFGQPLLDSLVDDELLGDLEAQGWWISAEDPNAPGMELARSMAKGATESPAGVLFLAADEDTIAGAFPSPKRRPTLVIGETDSENYIGPIRWLDALGAFAALAEESAPQEAQGIADGPQTADQAL